MNPINNSVPSKLPEPNASLSTYNEWLSQFRDLFLSHAISPDNVEKVLTSGKLLSQEAVLRKYGKVACEVSNFGERGIIENFKPELSVNKLFTIVYTKKKENKYIQYEIIPNEFLKTRRIPEGSSIKTFDKFSVIKSTFFAPVTSNYDSNYHQEEDSNYREKSISDGYIHAVSPFFPDTDHPAAFTHVDKLDDVLRSIFDHGIKKRLDWDRLSYALFAVRSRRYTALRANEIRVEKNCVRWTYGKVAVLMGNAEEKLAFGRSLLPNKHTDKYEFFLKSPFQTDSHFDISLDSNDVIILGSKVELDGYRANPAISQAVKDRFVNFEDLAQEQIEAWEVPRK